VLDKKNAKIETYRAFPKPMSAAQQLNFTEEDVDLLRLAKNLGDNPEMIAKVRASDEDLRYHRILTAHQAFGQSRIEEVLSPR
jgi:hypothetical protein